MYQYNVALTVVGVGVASLNLLALRVISRWRVDGSQRAAREEGKLAGVSVSGLRSIESLKASGRESDFFCKWAGHQANYVKFEQELGYLSGLLGSVPPLLSHVTTAAILLVGGWQVMRGGMTIGNLVAFQHLMSSFLGPVERLLRLGAELQQFESGLNRLDDTLRYPVDPETSREGGTQDGPPLRKLDGHLELRNVTFGYSPLEPPLISGLSLTLKPGARVALVGGSGSGKSTVTKLVTGLFEPWQGEVLFDGMARRSIPRRALTASIASVDQELFVFEGTVRDNLSLWDSTVSERAVILAAKDACIHDDIARRAQGYESVLAEGGANLSGGQCQRLEIARALVGGPRLLVLDEATSALDTETEQKIDENLRRRGCSCLVVAHRLSTIRDADEIIVLDRGKVVQRGTHEELATVDGPYARLIRS
jgi:ABC-type bacteriocin/lantibiotic exporter with double-glycine peptidase domain